MCHAANLEPLTVHDNGPDAQSRVTVSASRQALELLSRACACYIGGIFDAAPRIYTQLSIIR